LVGGGFGGLEEEGADASSGYFGSLNTTISFWNWNRRGRGKSYHAITQAINDFIEEAGNEWFAG
jgi:hypothetical protein